MSEQIDVPDTTASANAADSFLHRATRSLWARTRRQYHNLSPSESRRASRDAEALQNRLSFMADYPALADAAARGLAEHHAAYTVEVSSPIMAVSLESAACLKVLCQQVQPARVVDLGSGFSSFVVRSYAAEASQEVLVQSVDDNPFWLEKTGDYLRQQGVRDTHLLAWSAFLGAPEYGTFDLVFYDAGSMAFREANFAKAIAAARPGGLVLIDDMHKPDYRRSVLATLEAEGIEHYSLKQFTLDRLKRYAYLAIR